MKDKVQDFKVKLYADQIAVLGKVAEKRRVSRSQLIREAIDKVYRKGLNE